MEFEFFKPINGYDNYEVSNYGKVRNKKTGRILKGAMTNSGYMLVTLSQKGKIKSFSIHRLVMETFNPRPDMKTLDVNHIDWNKTNNRLENLEWTTHKDNLLYGSGPTELKRLESMLCNTIKHTLRQYYNELLNIHCTQEDFSNKVIEHAIINATQFYREKC